MAVHDDAGARNLVHTKLAQTREELRGILDPPPDHPGNGQVSGAAGFPRSRTMQLLMSGRGLGTLGALAGGLLMARPALALRLLRLVPASAVAKIVMGKALGALRAKAATGPRR